MTSIVWFRQDLRLADNPALEAAVAAGGPVVPVYIWDPESEHPWDLGAASRWWYHKTLEALQSRLAALGSRLVFRCGEASQILPALVAETNAQAVYWNRRYQPTLRNHDADLKKVLRESSTEVFSFNASLLFEPWTVLTGQGSPYRVFTPFWRRCRSAHEPGHPRPAPTALPGPLNWPASEPLERLDLRPSIPWDASMAAEWSAGEDAAHEMLEDFVDELGRYETGRNRPDQRATSRLSPYLAVGAIGPRQVWHRVQNHAASTAVDGTVGNAESYLRELVWREFAYHLLFHFPQTADQPLRPEFARFPWAEDQAGWKLWKTGQTGYPIVDAGMRELWSLGWMHNRVRMVVASFLVKDLLIPWQHGAAWFWDTLIDGDLASNTLGWQWTAGCGADAAPYFRVFNPVLQGQKFDPSGAYVRRWVPELSNLPDKWIHNPWQAPAKVLESAGVRLGSTYPQPVVDHARARNRALEAYQTIKRR